MAAAIAFAITLVVLGIFMPDVLRALETFLLTFFGKATAFLQAMPASPADISHVVR